MKKYFRTFFPEDEILGIDIGSYAIKFMLFSKDGNRILLKNWGYVPLPLKDSGNPVERKNIIVDEIKKHIKKYQIKTKYAATSISGSSVIVRYVKLPRMNKKELEERISIEAEAFIPFDINDVYLSTYILDNDVMEEGQNKMEVVLVAAKKEIVDERIEIIESSGMIPVLVDVDSFAIENLINFVEKDVKTQTESLMVVNIGMNVTNLSILVNKLSMESKEPLIKPSYYSRLLRDIFVSGISFDKALSKKMNIDLLSADEFKKGVKFLLTDEDKLNAISNYDKINILSSRALIESGKELVNEISRSIDFFVSSGIESTISKIYLCGGASSIKNLNFYLYDELKIPVEYLDPFSIVDNKPDNIPAWISYSLCVAAGLSLRRIEDL